MKIVYKVKFELDFKHIIYHILALKFLMGFCLTTWYDYLTLK